jgi:UDP-glucose 4-epimerase
LITWTIGSTGLIGSAIAHRSARIFPGSTFIPEPVPWADPSAAQESLTKEARAFAQAAGSQPWAIFWAAGAATVSSTRAQCLTEVDSLTALLRALRADPPVGPGVFFLASSAGGVYSGSAEPPFDDHTVPRPLNAYGEAKLLQEQAVTRELRDVCDVVIGRFSNIYGPGQNLDKLQGIVSRLALATATRQPLNMFVSLDTLRDYLFVDDAAAQAVEHARFALDERSDRRSHRVRVIASGEPVALSHVIRTMQAVTKKRAPLALGSHPSSVGQVHDLRLIPSAIECTAGAIPTPTHLAAGARAVYDDILARLQRPARPPGRRSA